MKKRAPIHYAIIYNRVEELRLLLENGADINQQWEKHNLNFLIIQILSKNRFRDENVFQIYSIIMVEVEEWKDGASYRCGKRKSYAGSVPFLPTRFGYV